MKFREYLKWKSKRPYVWAKEKDISISTVWRAYNNKHCPTLETIKKIEKATNGMVRPEDWY